MEDENFEMKNFKKTLPKIAYIYNKFVDRAVDFIDSADQESPENKDSFAKNSYTIMRSLFYVTKGIEKVDKLIRQINTIERDESISSEKLREIRLQLAQICQNPDFIPQPQNKNEEELFNGVRKINEGLKENHFFVSNTNVMYYFNKFKSFIKNSMTDEEKQDEIDAEEGEDGSEEYGEERLKKESKEPCKTRERVDDG